MAKAERLVLPTSGRGNDTPHLSLNQAAAALLALLNGAEQIPAIGQLRAVVRRACSARIISARGAGAMVEHRLTAAEAATAIVHLINTSPRTPWAGEIEAITARVGSVPVSSVPDRSRRRLPCECADVLSAPKRRDGADEARRTEHDQVYEYDTQLGCQSDVAGEVVLDTPPTTWGDLIGLASIVAHEAGHDLDALGARRTNDGDPGPKAT